MFLGKTGAAWGETCALAILIGGIYLILRRVISPVIPVTYLATAALFSFLFGRDPLFDLLSGGLMLGAFFMATDYTTSPLYFWGRVVFAVGCGALTLVIREFGSLPEGVSLFHYFDEYPHASHRALYQAPGRFGLVKKRTKGGREIMKLDAKKHSGSHCRPVRHLCRRFRCIGRHQPADKGKNRGTAGAKGGRIPQNCAGFSFERRTTARILCRYQRQPDCGLCF